MLFLTFCLQVQWKLWNNNKNRLTSVENAALKISQYAYKLVKFLKISLTSIAITIRTVERVLQMPLKYLNILKKNWSAHSSRRLKLHGQKVFAAQMSQKKSFWLEEEEVEEEEGDIQDLPKHSLLQRAAFPSDYRNLWILKCQNRNLFKAWFA